MSFNKNRYSETKRDNGTVGIFALALLAGIICMSVAASYLAIADSYTEVWEHGLLYQVAIKDKSHRSCTTHKRSDGSTYQTCSTDHSYNIQEFFEKISISENGTYIHHNKYVIVDRFTEYSYYEAAYNKLQKTKIGTRRQIYVYSTTGYTGKAYDEKNLRYFTTIGYVLMSFFSLFFGGVFAILIFVAMADWYENFYELHPDLKGINIYDHYTDEVLNNATNLSSSYMPRSWNLFWKMADTDESGVISLCEFCSALGGVFISLFKSLFYAISDLTKFICNVLGTFFVMLLGFCSACCVYIGCILCLNRLGFGGNNSTYAGVRNSNNENTSLPGTIQINTLHV